VKFLSSNSELHRSHFLRVERISWQIIKASNCIRIDLRFNFVSSVDRGAIRGHFSLDHYAWHRHNINLCVIKDETWIGAKRDFTTDMDVHLNCCLQGLLPRLHFEYFYLTVLSLHELDIWWITSFVFDPSLINNTDLCDVMIARSL